MVGTSETPKYEKWESNQSYGVSASGVYERARATTDNELHTDTKYEGSTQHGNSDGCMCPDEFIRTGSQKRESDERY
jgi:hypothetical protein